MFVLMCFFLFGGCDVHVCVCCVCAILNVCRCLLWLLSVCLEWNCMLLCFGIGCIIDVCF